MAYDASESLDVSPDMLQKAQESVASQINAEKLLGLLDQFSSADEINKFAGYE